MDHSEKKDEFALLLPLSNCVGVISSLVLFKTWFLPLTIEWLGGDSKLQLMASDIWEETSLFLERISKCDLGNSNSKEPDNFQSWENGTGDQDANVLGTQWENWRSEEDFS